MVTDPVVQLEKTQLSVEPGGEVRMLVTVRNLGSMTESFRLEVLGEGAAEWSKITPSELRVYPEQGATVLVVFSPPAGNTTRNGTFPFAVRAESIADADVSAVAEGDLEIGQALGLAQKPIKLSVTVATVLVILVLGGVIAFTLTRPPLQGASPYPIGTPSLGTSPPPTKGDPSNEPGSNSVSAIATTPTHTQAPPATTQQILPDPPSGGTSAPATTSTTSTTTSSAGEDVATFSRNCEHQFTTSVWHAGNVLYPRSMNLELGGTSAYDAIVELGDAGAPPKQMIAATDPTSEPVLVQCLISAKLVSVDDDIEVGSATTELTESDGWYLQTFTPTGAVEWTWTVTPRAPGEHSLQLLLRPAVAYGGLATGSSTGQQAYVTDVTVTASTMENVSYWFDTQFTLLGKIVGVLGAAVIGVLTWLLLFSETWGKLRKQPQPAPATPSDSDRRRDGVAGRSDRGRRGGPRTQTGRRPPRRPV